MRFAVLSVNASLRALSRRVRRRPILERPERSEG